MISAGYELRNALTGWEKAVKDVPDAWLAKAYDRAAEGWDWLNKKLPFTPDAIQPAYRLLLKEERERAEADRRNAARRNRDTYQCWHCCDLGYQPVFVWSKDRWYQAVRPCSCDIAPASQRNAAPLGEPDWIRNLLGQYVKRAELVKYGAPNDTFESFSFRAGDGGIADRMFVEKSPSD